jgi:hypothetical protein
MTNDVAHKQQVSFELIRRGSIRHMLLPNQKKIYDGLKRHRRYAVYSARKLGKSYTACLIAIEHCIMRKDAIVRHVFPTLKAGRDVIVSLMNEIMPLLPPECRPQYKKSQERYIFPNGAEYLICGASPDSIEGSRGPRCTLFIFDEVAFYEATGYEYALKSVFYPQMSIVADGMMLYVTTPPSNMNHPFIKETLIPFMKSGAFIKLTVYDNPLITSDKRAELIEICGGEDTNSWKREYLAEMVSDETMRVISAFRSKDHILDLDIEDLDSFGERVPYRGLLIVDTSGGKDLTGLLACLYNHKLNELWILGEYTCPQILIGDLVRKMMEMKHQYLWMSTHTHPVIDCFPDTAKELRQIYQIPFQHPRKTKVVDSMMLVNEAFNAGRVKIAPNCKLLISMIQEGMWKDTKTTRDFERTPEFGHLDLLACLGYAVKHCPWGRSPDYSTNAQLTLGSVDHAKFKR